MCDSNASVAACASVAMLQMCTHPDKFYGRMHINTCLQYVTRKPFNECGLAFNAYLILCKGSAEKVHVGIACDKVDRGKWFCMVLFTHACLSNADQIICADLLLCS